MLSTLFENPDWRKQTRLLKLIFEKSDHSTTYFAEKFIKTVLANVQTVEQLSLLDLVIDLNNPKLDELLFEFVLTKPFWFSKKSVLLKTLRRSGFGMYSYSRNNIYSSPWNEDLDLVKYVISNESGLSVWDRLKVLQMSSITGNYPELLISLWKDAELKVPNKESQKRMFRESIEKIVVKYPEDQRYQFKAIFSHQVPADLSSIKKTEVIFKENAGFVCLSLFN